MELALSNAPNVRNTAVELYYKDSIREVEGRFKPLLEAAKRDGSPEHEKLRLQGSTYFDLFRGIRSDVDFA